MGVKRFDRGTYGKPKKLPNGFLRADALPTRVGVFKYIRPDGTTFRELRLPEEVFRADSLDSLALAPITDDHPDVFVDATNARLLARGSVGEKVSHDGEYVRATVMVTDAESIKRIEDGTQQELSCGYTCDLEIKAGQYGDDHYDAVQRNIVYNHVALVTKGRAGPEARVRMDASSAVMVLPDVPDAGKAIPPTLPNSRPEASVAHKARIDGVEYEVPSEQVVQALAKVDKAHADALAASAAELKTAKAEVEKLQAKIDAQAEELKKAHAELKAAPEKLRSDMAARMTLETQARKVLGAKFKLDQLDAKAIKLAVLGKLTPDVKLDGKSEDYLQARFDLAIEAAGDEEDAPRDAVDRARVLVGDAHEEEDEREDTEVDAEKAAELMRKQHRDAWKRSLNPGGANASK